VFINSDPHMVDYLAGSEEEKKAPPTAPTAALFRPSAAAAAGTRATPAPGRGGKNGISKDKKEEGEKEKEKERRKGEKAAVAAAAAALRASGGEGARARNTSLNESLGKVTHVFCDKTGTLTTNGEDEKSITLGIVAIWGSRSVGQAFTHLHAFDFLPLYAFPTRVPAHLQTCGCACSRSGAGGTGAPL
jgi:hypothetical protein